jgi:hypothetical protein
MDSSDTLREQPSARQTVVKNFVPTVSGSTTSCPCSAVLVVATISLSACSTCAIVDLRKRTSTFRARSSAICECSAILLEEARLANPSPNRVVMNLIYNLIRIGGGLG